MPPGNTINFEKVAETIPMMVWITDSKGSCIYLNKQWSQYLGQTPSIALGYGWQEAIHLEDVDRIKKNYTKSVEKKVPFKSEYRLKNKTGEYRWMLDEGTPTFDTDGNFTGYIGIVSDIHERKITAEELSESEQNFRNLAEAIPQIVWVTRADGYHEYYNNHWHTYTGKSFDDTKGDQWSSILHPDDKARAEHTWQNSLETGELYEIEYRLRDKTGEYKWFLARALPIKNRYGFIKRWFGTCTDIHEQKLLLEAQIFLAEAGKVLSSSLDYRKTLERVAHLAVPHIADWCSIELLENGELGRPIIAHIDPAKEKWAYDLNKNRNIDMNAPQGLPNVLRTGKAEFYSHITAEMIKGAARNEKEYKLLKKIGFTSVMIAPIVIENRTVGAIQFVTTESQKHFHEADMNMGEKLASRVALAIQNAQLYEEVKKRELQFKALYDSNIIGVFFGNVNNSHGGVVLEANDAFLQMTGYSRTDLDTNKVTSKRLTPPEYVQDTNEQLKKMQKMGYIPPFEKEYIKKDGSQVPVIIGSVMLDQKKGDIITFVLDITERKKLEQRKDEFIGIASHELKTPLTNIKGYVQILERVIQQMGDERLNQYVKKTNTYINRLNSLITDLLDVSKIQAGKLDLNYSTFRFDNLVKAAVESVQHTNHSHTVILEGKTNIMMKGDKHRLEQVFTNVLTNAIKYSPNADSVIITVSRDEECINVKVQDFGVGIPKKEISKLFQRFFRVEATSKKFSGLGIGLYISNEIVKRHGGKMWVESDYGKGSTFYFSLPVKKARKQKNG